MKTLIATLILPVAICCAGPSLLPRKLLPTPANQGLVPPSHCNIFYNLTDWPTYAVLRFTHRGQPIEVQTPFIDAEVSDYPTGNYVLAVDEREQKRDGAAQYPIAHPPGQLPAQFRFGNLHFAVAFYGNRDGHIMRGETFMRCVYGGDTMHVRLLTNYSYNTFIDNIKFKKGYYELDADDSRLNSGVLEQLPVPTYFGAYFKQHQAELAHENPFTNCRFTGNTSAYPMVHIRGYAPSTPADIPRLMLVHTPFYRVPLASIRPVSNWWKAQPKR